MNELFLFLSIVCKVDTSTQFESEVRKCIDFTVNCIKFEGDKIVKESLDECEKRYRKGERFNEKDSTN